jgi:hypothetical protein
MPNELTMGTRRTGNLIDFDPDTPHVHVTLERSSEGISATVPWSGEDSPYAAWFDAGDSRRLRKSDRGGSPRTMPRRLLFQDSHGSVLLTGCWARGFHATIDGPGSGTVWSRAAIMGIEADIDFDRPHGLQTEISGLREWLKVTSWSQEIPYEDGALVARIHSLRTPVIEIGTFKGISFEFRPAWQIVPEDRLDRILLLDLVRPCSRAVEPVLWEDHLELHRAVRDLLVLSRWRRETCVAVRAYREDDPLRTLDGKEHGGQWRDVIVPDGDRQSPPSGYSAHLIEYQDLGPAGVARWIDLRNEFARALDPVITSIDLDATANTLLAHTGPGLEALGYLLMLRDGAGPKRASSAKLRERLERVLAEIDDVVPFDGATWVAKTVETYNGLKHANRQLPDDVDVANAWRECVLAVRAWVALELGVPAQKVAATLNKDRQRHPYVRRT